MPLQDSEIVWRPAQTVSDSVPAQNGGRMRFIAVPSGVKNNLLPDVTKAEREAGSVKWRKAFIHIASTSNIPLINARIFLDTPTPAEDFVLLYAGNATDTQDQIAGRPYGIGTLAATANAGATSFDVMCESADYETLLPFQIGDIVRIGLPSGAAGNEQFAGITAVNYLGATATLDIDTPLQFDFTAPENIVSSVIEQASIEASIVNFAVSSVAGTFDDVTAGNVTTPAVSAVDDAWTLTFTSTSDFTAAGLATGAIGNGTIYGDYAPINPATGQPYFSLKMAAWGDPWDVGDTLTFDTAPAALALWYRREVPVGAASSANNAASVTLYGESA